MEQIDIEVCEQCKGSVKIAAPAHLTFKGRSMASCHRGINASMHVMTEMQVLHRDRDVTY